MTVLWARRGRYRPYFENYTVDASILDSTERSDHINDDIWRME